MGHTYEVGQGATNAAVYRCPPCCVWFTNSLRGWIGVPERRVVSAGSAVVGPRGRLAVPGADPSHRASTFAQTASNDTGHDVRLALRDWTSALLLDHAGEDHLTRALSAPRAICARPHGYRIRHEDETNASAI